MKAAIFLILFLATPTDQYQCRCYLAENLYQFMRTYVPKFIEPEFQRHDFGCLNHLYRGFRTACSCQLNRYAKYITTKNCYDLRVHSRFIDRNLLETMYAGAKAVNFTSALDLLGFEYNDICRPINTFNFAEESKRTKEYYAEIFDKSIKFAMFAWIREMVDKLRSYNETNFAIPECFYDIISDMAKRFKVSVGFSLKCLYDQKACDEEKQLVKG